ncbi:MAG: hypothetical protein P8X39_08080 [Desulfofustis sp.]
MVKGLGEATIKESAKTGRTPDFLGLFLPGTHILQFQIVGSRIMAQINFITAGIIQIDQLLINFFIVLTMLQHQFRFDNQPRFQFTPLLVKQGFDGNSLVWLSMRLCTSH